MITFLNNIKISLRLKLLSFTIFIFFVLLAYITNNLMQKVEDNLSIIEKKELNLIFFSQNLKDKISQAQDILLEQISLKVSSGEDDFELLQEKFPAILKELNDFKKFADASKDEELINISKSLNFHYLLFSSDSIELLSEEYDLEQSKYFFETLHQISTNVNDMNQQLTQLMQYSRSSLNNVLDILHEEIENNKMKIALTSLVILFFVMLSLIFLSRNIISKIDSLTYGMKKFKEGDLNYKIDSVNYKDELSDLSKSFNQMTLSLSNTIKEKEEKHSMLIQSSKMAAMGEMIANIAHQWRQPLSLISTSVTGMKLQKELGILDDKDVNKNFDKIIDATDYLSQTIEDFRNFFKESKESVKFNIENILQKNLVLVGPSMKENNITIINDIEKDLLLEGLENELTQGILNILNNAKDALNENTTIEKKLVFLSAKKSSDKKNIVVTIKDNGGGIPDKIINKIFEPYFTTKHQSQGTGIGLFMTRQIIMDNMKGSISVDNKEFTYEDENYKGAEFVITLPIL